MEIRDINKMSKEEKPKTNPNGANQYLIDPRQKKCWDLYVNPKSETFGNALQSALKAGYTEGTANQITTEKWFIEKLRRLNMFSKAERNLNEFLDMDVEEIAIIKGIPLRDKNGNFLMKKDINLLRLKQDTSKFVAERLGKNEGYSTKTELEAPDNLIKVNINIDEAIKKVYGKSSSGTDASNSERS